MSLLIFGLYFADIVTGLTFVSSLVLIILGILALAFILGLMYEVDVDCPTKPGTLIRIFKMFYKKYFAVLVFSVFTFTALPSKNTVYIATGLITGKTVMEQVQTNPLYEKSMKLLEKKIDKALSENIETNKAGKK